MIGRDWPWSQAAQAIHAPLVTSAVPGADSAVTPGCHHACHLGRICDTRKGADWRGRAAMSDDRPGVGTADDQRARSPRLEPVRSGKSDAAARARTSFPRTQPAAAVEALGGRRSHAGRVLPARSSRPRSARSPTRCSRYRPSVTPRRGAGRQRDGHPGAGQPVAALGRGRSHAGRVAGHGRALCSEYPYMPSRPAAHRGPGLAAADDSAYRGQRITLEQHREILVQAAGSHCCSAAWSTTPATGQRPRPPARRAVARRGGRPSRRSRPGRTRSAPG